MALKFLRDWRLLVPQALGNAALPSSDQVRLEYRTMTVEDVFRAQEEVGINFLAAGDQTKDPAEQRRNWQMMRHVLITYTRNWENVEVDGKALVAGEEVADSAGIDAMELLGEVVAHVVSQSQGTEAEAKNSAGQSGPESSGSGSTAEPASPTGLPIVATADGSA